MIRGVLFNPSNPGHLPLPAMPLIPATITIPRLSVSRTLHLLVDTGADVTSLHLRDAVQMLGLHGIRQLRGRAACQGVGGSAEYFTEPALIVFLHDDGRPQGFQVDLRIAKLASAPEEVALQLRLPSILGRDVISQFRMLLDYATNQLVFE